MEEMKEKKENDKKKKNNSTLLIVGLIILAVVIIAAIFMFSKKNPSSDNPSASSELSNTELSRKAKEFCNQKNVDSVSLSESHSLIKVTSSLLGGGATYYTAQNEDFSCPVIGPDSM